MKKPGLLFYGVAALVLVIFAGIGTPRFKRHALAVGCANRMISVAFAARVWIDDHNGQRPPDFRSMSNELNTPRILICPADSQQQFVNEWSSFSPSNSTYEILGALSNEVNSPLFRCPIHGYVAYTNGSVFDGKRLLKKGAL